MYADIKKNKTIPAVVCLVLILVLVQMLFLPSAGFTAESSAKIKEITPPPAAGRYPDVNSREFLEYYFDDWGKVDQLGDGFIIINDRRFVLAPDSEISGARIGKYIGVHVNDNGEVVKSEKIGSPPVR